MISASDLAAPIVFAHETLGQFYIWDGPGTTINAVPQTEGFIIDWSKGKVAGRPAGLRRY